MTLTTHDPEKSAVGTEIPAAREGARSRGLPSVSVIIPAHDEATTLPACLQSVLRQDYAGAIRVIVVDNGSRDGTADVAGQWVSRFAAAGHEMLVLQLERGNKCAALNEADSQAVGSCRIYLDADTEISANCVSRVAAALADGCGVGICCPRIQIAPARSWVTRRYGRV